ncbi:MAG: short-chain dehydrogenase reductase [Lasallia pustulata]|uniref:Short-chain dehydrogenase reductase n=1 Tax=Lasallia pustulata TaxID=136370 RepID=A0A5M8Q042_9LECA|nr:MAG: short-chain dehydrogenase reductase [Lasallia pustulata]
MDILQTEFITNYLSYLALTKGFLPFLLGKKAESALMYTTSGLALVPMLRCPNYCASKAALHHFILCLREQLKETKVKVVELYPPAVQTELHDEKHQPDLKHGSQIGMPLDQFTQEAYDGLAAGKEQVPVGMSKQPFDTWEAERQKQFHGMIEAMAGTLTAHT